MRRGLARDHPRRRPGGRGRIAPHLRPTPLFSYTTLDELVDAEVWVKHENHQPVGAFKVRGGVNLVSQLDEEERRRGLIAASTGNHGQSVAFASRIFGVDSLICVPEGANPVKLDAMRALGAELVIHGDDFDAAREHCQRLAAEHGYRYVNSGNEPLLIAGVATGTLEILEDRPDVDAIVVPIGGGSGAAGACIVAKTIRPEIQVIGVQAEAAPAAFRSWQARELPGGRDRHSRRGPRNASPVRVAAADPLGASRRLRPRRRGRAQSRDSAADRAHAQSRRTGRSGLPRRRVEAARAAAREADRARAQRWQPQSRAACRAVCLGPIPGPFPGSEKRLPLRSRPNPHALERT